MALAAVAYACGGQVSDGIGGESHFVCRTDGDCAVHGSDLTCSDDHVCVSMKTGTLATAAYWKTCPSYPNGARTGDLCGYGTDCSSDFCSCGGGNALDGSAQICNFHSDLCDQSGILRVSTSTLVGCDAAYQPDFRPTQWTDCTQALENGRSGDTCADAWVCTSAADDPCCIDVAECSTSIPASLGGGWKLARYHVCSDECAALRPNPELAPATDCVSAHDGALRAGQPCSGSFICVDAQGPRATPLTITDGTAADTFFWCGGGVVQVATGVSNASL